VGDRYGRKTLGGGIFYLFIFMKSLHGEKNKQALIYTTSVREEKFRGGRTADVCVFLYFFFE
jgi:hypothetical protein